jgi:hypothetical protein
MISIGKLIESVSCKLNSPDSPEPFLPYAHEALIKTYG